MKQSPYTEIILKEARKRGIKTSPFDNQVSLAVLKRNNKQTLIYQSLTELVSAPARIVAKDKYLTNYFLNKHKFPVPKAKLIRNLEEAILFLKKYKKVVVKPLSLSQGKGITVGIKTKTELKEAIDLAISVSKKQKNNFSLIIEQAVPGDDHRILVIDYKKVFAIKKIPAYVVGDGTSTILGLIETKNKQKVKHKKLIVVDAVLEKVLSRQKLTLSSIPRKGKQIFVRRTANLSTGGESIDITDDINPKIKKMAIEAAKAMKLPVVGFDFMCRDYTQSKGYFIEANPIPGFLIHHFPHVGKPRNPAKALIDLLIKKKLI